MVADGDAASGPNLTLVRPGARPIPPISLHPLPYTNKACARPLRRPTPQKPCHLRRTATHTSAFAWQKRLRLAIL